MSPKFLTFAVVGAAVILSGCFQTGSSDSTDTTAGIYKSFDFGETWAPQHRFLHSGGVGTISDTNILQLQFDPQDFQAVYATTAQDGILYTYDAGESWQQPRILRQGRVDSLAVDPFNKCVIYATLANTIVKTVDCGRAWNEIFIDTVVTKLVTSLAVDPRNSLTVLAGNSAGDMIKSSDGGGTWRVVNRVNNPIKRILVDALDSQIVYLATQSRGIFKSLDNGETWTEINDGLKPYSASLEYRHLIPLPDTQDGLLLAAKHGLLFSTDGGETWTPISLLTPPATADILAVAVNPGNSNEIYYATSSTFYKTNDAGQNWVTRRLPTNAAASYLLADPNSPNVIYLGLSASQR